MEFKKNIYADLSIVDFKNVDEFVNQFIDICEDVKYWEKYQPCVAVYGKSEFIWKIFKKVTKKCNFDIGALHFRRDYFDDQGDVFCLRVFDDNMLVIEEAYRGDGIPYIPEGIVFINEEDCSQDLIDSALENGADTTLIGFNSKDETKPKKSETATGDNVDIFYDDDDKPHGFYATHKGENSKSSVYYYGNKALTSKQVDEILKLYGKD